MAEKRKPDDPEQSKRFEEAARAAEADPRAFEQIFSKIVPPKKKGAKPS